MSSDLQMDSRFLHEFHSLVVLLISSAELHQMSSTTPETGDYPGLPKDAEGLHEEYDVILCGTGLVQSILASALARAGKTILHCDGNDYYGEFDAVVSRSYEWNELDEQAESIEEELKNLVQLLPRAKIRYLSSKTRTAVALEVGTQVKTPYGTGRILCRSPLQIQLEHWILANGSSPILYMDETTLENGSLIATRQTQAEDLLKNRFSLDLTCSLLFASGVAVEGLLVSGVAEYLEFKSIEGLLWSEVSGDEAVLSRVPCSKADVFSTLLLSPLDKRKLMKFLQLALDYATVKSSQTETDEGEDEMSSVVESSKPPMATGTATTAAPPTGEEEVQFLNEKHLNQGRSLARPQNKAVSTKDLETLQASLDMDFSEYLKKQAKLSPKLIALVSHALALQNARGASTEQAMTRLCQHVQALGRFGMTALLVPLYGSGELSQAFCRSAAVHGGTYLLRRAPKSVLLDKQERAAGIVLGGDDSSDYGGCTVDKEIRSSYVVVPGHAIRKAGSAKTCKHLLRRISIVQGRVLLEYSEQRHVVIIPPGEVGNRNVIYGVALDAGVQIAPAGCTVLHLSTVVEAPVTNPDVLKKAARALKVREMSHVAFSYPLVDNTAAEVQGLHVCRPAGDCLVVDDAFEQAREIFERICPGQGFLKLSVEMNAAIEERLVGRNDEEDDEHAVLQSAVKMMALQAEDDEQEASFVKEPQVEWHETAGS